jgi:uncharacterized protein YpmS
VTSLIKTQKNKKNVSLTTNLSDIRSLLTVLLKTKKAEQSAFLFFVFNKNVRVNLSTHTFNYSLSAPSTMSVIRRNFLVAIPLTESLG